MPEQSYREAFLHYVWQFQYFTKSDLTGTNGEIIKVISPGYLNHNAGPDFYNAHLIINNIEWFGTVEIHYKTSDWNNHSHSENKLYNNVILHLVWMNDEVIQREDGSVVPTLELKNRIEPAVTEKYQYLLQTIHLIPCQDSFSGVDSMIISSMAEKTLVERLQVKSLAINELLEVNNNNWEETCYQWIGKCFGFKINSEPFSLLCNYLPQRIIKKYFSLQLSREALLFGVSGFLNDKTEDPFVCSLQNEYRFLKNKHSLARELDLHQWRFLRLRPSNFPSLRIAQFSAFLGSPDNLSNIVFHYSLSEIKKSLNAPVNEFWQTHYHFRKKSAGHDCSLGDESSNNLLINAFVPLKFAYALKTDNEMLMAECLDILKILKPEKNKITRCFSDLGYKIGSASESQGFIQLFNNYCLTKKCLSCRIGHEIIRNSVLETVK